MATKQIQEFLDKKVGKFVQQAYKVKTMKEITVPALGTITVFEFEYACKVIEKFHMDIDDVSLYDILEIGDLDNYSKEEANQIYDRKNYRFRSRTKRKELIKNYVEMRYSDAYSVIECLNQYMEWEDRTIIINNNPYLPGLYDVLVDKFEKYFGSHTYEEVKEWLDNKRPMDIKKIVKESLKDKIAIVKHSDLDGTWSADAYVNKQKGRKPFVRNGFTLNPATKGHELKKAVFMTEEDAATLNALGAGIRDLTARYNKLLGEVTGKTSEHEGDN